MKRFLSVGSLLAAALLAGEVGAAEAQVKIGYVNTQRLVAEAPGAKEAQQTLEREMSGYRTQVDSLEKNLQQMQADYQKQEASLTAAVKQQRQQAMQQSFATYQQRVGQLEQTAAQRQQQLVEPVMKRVKDAIEAARREGGYAIIFDGGNSGMVAADPALDLTDRVLTRLRAGGTTGGK